MNVNNFNFKVGSHEEIKKLAKRVGKDIGTLRKLITTTREDLVAAINELKQEQSDITGRIEVLEELHKKPVDQGPASEYPGAGWYKATDTGIVYNKGVPEGETYKFEGDPTEYISVWRNEGIDLDTFEGTEEDIQKLHEWHKNLHRYATSNVTDMSYWMFGYGSPEIYEGMGISPDFVIDSVDISHYDTSNVTNMEGMFYDAKAFNQPLDNFVTSNVTNMHGTFYGAISFNQDISSWDTSKVTNMSRMFLSAITFNQDISSWDTSSVNSMESMFERAVSFNQDLSQWCVPLITTAPIEFDSQASSWTLPRPVWGTCPRGEDQA